MGSFNLEPVILNDRVTKEFVRRLVQLLPSGFFVGAVQFDLEIFTHVHGFDAAIAHVFERVLHGLALRIEHRFFGRNNNFGFHLKKSKAVQSKLGSCRRRKSNTALPQPHFPEIFYLLTGSSRRKENPSLKSGGTTPMNSARWIKSPGPAFQSFTVSRG